MRKGKKGGFFRILEERCWVRTRDKLCLYWGKVTLVFFCCCFLEMYVCVSLTELKSTT